MTTPLSSRKMTIPRSRSEDIFVYIATVIVIAFVLLAIVNLCEGEALIASSLWLVLVTIWNWSRCREQGGVRRFLINWMGGLAGRRFVEADMTDAQPQNIRFGFDLMGHCFIQKSILLDSIDSVEWSTGQATDMAGHDMNDWHVGVWFDHHDPRKSEHEKKFRLRKPDQDIYCVGPSTRKGLTEALGLSLVAFLRDAGADLIQGDTTTCYVRQRDAGEVRNFQPGIPPNSGVT